MSATLDQILRRLRPERSLSAFQPVLVGPHALGLDRPGDTIEVRCHAPDPDRFRDRIRAMYGDLSGFSPDDTGCRLSLLGTPIHIIGQPTPTRAQDAVRRHHMLVRLMRSLGPPLVRRVKQRPSGQPLEEAFALALGCDDVLDLEDVKLVQLRELWRTGGRRPPAPVVATPAAPAAPPAPAPAAPSPEPEPEPEPEEESLLRSPDSPLMRQHRWVNAAGLLSRGDMPLAGLSKKKS